jgi:hypothetical protein
MSFTHRRGGETDPDPDGIDQAGEAQDQTARETDRAGNMLPRRQGRRFALERGLVRLVATTGIIGIGVLLGAILGSNKVQGWTTGLVVAIVSVVLAALLWSSRQL